MLVVTRKPKEIIRINDNIVVEVLIISNGSVKIGIQAPKDVPVMRGELKGPCRKTRKDSE